jgi:hypothetical protein
MTSDRVDDVPRWRKLLGWLIDPWTSAMFAIQDRLEERRVRRAEKRGRRR